jgi:DNA repair exonuclease SbcCD ATPase subunit
MEKKEIERLEREREKLEEARARLEEEREHLEEERERFEEAREDMREHRKEAKAEHREWLTEEQQRKLEEVQEKVEKAMEGVQDKIENAIAGIDFEKLDKDIDVQMKQTTKNLGIMNLKEITPEELEKIEEIKNLGVIIAPEELMSKVSSKVTKNLGTIVPYKKGWRLYSGHTVINKAMLEALEEPMEFIQTGHLEIHDDVTPELVKTKIKAFHNYGHIHATEEIYGVLTSRCLENYGHISKGNGED